MIRQIIVRGYCERSIEPEIIRNCFTSFVATVTSGASSQIGFPTASFSLSSAKRYTFTRFFTAPATVVGGRNDFRQL
jgi:hypothetical protein